MPLAREDIAASVYRDREDRWLVQALVRTVPGFFRLWGPVSRLDEHDVSDEDLGKGVRHALDGGPDDLLAADQEPTETPWAMTGRGYRSFCRGTALVHVHREGEDLVVMPEENRMFIRPNPGFYERPELAIRLPLTSTDAEVGSAVRRAARAVATPL